MSILVALALFAPVNMAAAGPKSPNLAKCSGKQRRPANPYGSILPTVDLVNGTATPAGQVFPEKNPAEPKPTRPDGKPDGQVPPISGLSPQSSHRSC
jgi:hypothetical protein